MVRFGNGVGFADLAAVSNHQAVLYQQSIVKDICTTFPVKRKSYLKEFGTGLVRFGNGVGFADLAVAEHDVGVATLDNRDLVLGVGLRV